MNQLSPETYALLQARGILPPSQAPQAPPDPAILAYAQGLQGNAPPPAPAGPAPGLPRTPQEAQAWQAMANAGAPPPSDELPPQAQQAAARLAAGHAPTAGNYLPSSGAPSGPNAHGPPDRTPYRYVGEGNGTGVTPSASVDVHVRPQPAPTLAGSPLLSGGGGVAPSTSWQSTVSPTTRAMMEAADTEKDAAIQRLGEAQAGQTQAEADAQWGLAGRAAQEDVDMQAAERKRSHAIDAQMADYAAAQKAASEGTLQYDRRGTGARVAGAIFMALGQLGAGLTGGRLPNTAREIIDEQIKADYQQQKDELAKRGAAAERSGNLLEKLRQRFGDDRAAESAFRAQRWQQYGLQAQAMATEAKSPAMKAQADLLKAGADQEMAAHHQAMEHQVVTGGGGIDWRKQYMDDQRKFDEAALKGETPAGARFPSFQEYVASHGGAGGGAPVQGVGKEGAAGQPMPTPIPQSTAYDPTRFFQGTEANRKTLDQGAWNLNVVSAVKKRMGERISPEALDHIAGQYKINPGDTEGTIRYKSMLAQRDLGIGPQAAQPGAPTASSFSTPVGAR
jgi:hypothetical protein